MKNNILTSTVVITLLLGLTHPVHAFGRKKAKTKTGPATISGSTTLSDAIAAKPTSGAPSNTNNSNSGGGNSSGASGRNPGSSGQTPTGPVGQLILGAYNPLNVPGCNPLGNPLAPFTQGGGAGGTTGGGGGIGGGGIGALLGGNAAGGLPGGFFGAMPGFGGGAPGASGDFGGGAGMGGGLVNPPVVTKVSP